MIKVALWLGVMALCTAVMMMGWMKWGDGESTVSLKWLQMCQTFALFILPAIGAVGMWSDKPMKWLHLDRPPGWETAVYAYSDYGDCVAGDQLAERMEPADESAGFSRTFRGCDAAV